MHAGRLLCAVLAVVAWMTHAVMAEEDDGPWSEDQFIKKTFNINRVLFKGNEAFTDAKMRASLAHHPDVRSAMHAFSGVDFRRALKTGITLGYLASGFPEVQVRFSLIDQDGLPYLCFSVTEGPRYNLRSLEVVDSPPDYPPELIKALLTQPLIDHAPQQPDDPRQPSHDPLLTIGGHARCDIMWPKRAAQIINRWIARYHPDGHVPMQIRTHAFVVNPYEMRQLVRVLPDTELPIIRAIRCEGDLHQVPEAITGWLASETGLDVGVPASCLIKYRVRRILRDSGCFVRWDMVFEPDPQDSQQVTVVLHLDQHATLPLAGAALTVIQEDMKRLHDRLHQDLSGQDAGFVLTFAPDDTDFVVDMAFWPGQGVFLGLKQDEGTADYDLSLLLTADQTVWSSARRAVRYRLARTDQYGMNVTVSLKPLSSSPDVPEHPLQEADDSLPAPPFSIFFGYGASSGSRGLSVDFRSTPMPFLSLATYAAERTERDDGTVRLLFANQAEVLFDQEYRLLHASVTLPEMVALVMRRASGRFMELQDQGTDQVDDGWQIQQVDGLLSLVQIMATDLEPLLSLLSPAGQSSFFGDLGPVFAEKMRGVTALLRAMESAVSDVLSAVAGDAFSIPELPSDEINAAAMMLAHLAASAQEFMAHDAWPVVILSEASRYVEGVSTHGQLTVRKLMHDDRIGPLGYFCAAVLLDWIHVHDTARIFAEKALQTNSAEAVLRELTLLLGDPQPLVSVFSVINAEDFSLLLPVSDRSAVIAAIRSLQAAPEDQDRSVLLPAIFDAIWPHEMQALFRYAIEALVPERDLEGPTILQQPKGM